MSLVVYLDTAILLRVLDQGPGPSTFGRLLRREDILWVFSPAHYDDVVASNEQRRATFWRLLGEWPNQRWIVGGNLIPLIELECLLSPETTSGRGIRLHRTHDEVAHTYPDWFEIRDAQTLGSRGLEEISTQRAEEKTRASVAATRTKEASAISRKPDRQLQAEFGEFLKGSPPSPRVEEEWPGLQEAAAAALDELESVPGGWAEQLARQKPQFGLDASQIAEALGCLPDLLRAYSDGDATTAERLRPIFEEQVQKHVCLVNPLGLSINSAELSHYQLFLIWLPDEIRRDLQKDNSRLRKAFELWLGALDQCPGGRVVREVAWQMHLDSATRVKPSDETDLMHVAALPYVDVIFVDKRIKTYLDRSSLPEKWKARCFRNFDFESWATDVLNP